MPHAFEEWGGGQMFARLRLGAALCSVLILGSSPVLAQEPLPEFELPDVISPGRRPQQVATSPAYVTAIPGEELRRMGFVTLGDALTFLAEVSVRTAGNGLGGLQQASIRGSTPQQVLVLIDGVPLNATAQFGVNLATITLADVERVEVLRGPYSAIHGNFAVIQVVTHRRPGRLAYGSYGTNDTAVGALRVGGALGGMVYGFSSESTGTSGYRPNADATRWTGSGRFTFERVAGGTLTLGIHRTTGESGVPGSTDFPSLVDRLADGRTVLSLEWTRGTPDGSRTQLRIWSLDDRLHFSSPGFDSDSSGTASGAEWQRVVRVNTGGVFTWGASWQQASFASQSAFSSFQASSTTTAGYAQYDLLIGPRTSVGVGLRSETDSIYGARVDPRAGFVHFLTQSLRLRGGVGHTSRPPTFGELFFPLCSNPNLKPEEAWVADLGVEVVVRPGLLGRVNGFYTDAHNLIVGGCNPLNVGSARVAGFSAEMVGRLGDRWAIMGNLTRSDGLDRTTGLSLLRLPPLQANLILRYLVGGGATLSVLANYVSERPDFDFSTFPATRVTLPPYTTVGLRVEKAIGDLTQRAGVDNLLDERYEPLKGFPAPGRTYFIQVGGTF